MNPRTTGILFLVAAALGAFVWFYEIRGEEGRRQLEEEAKKLFPGVESEDVAAIEFRAGDGTEVRLLREAGAWRLAAPLSFPADEFAADGMASALTGATSEREIEDPRPPEVYGLGPDAREIAFRVDGEERRLRLGDTAPVGGSTYAAVDGSDAVYTLATFSVSALDKSVEELRDKRVARFDEASVRRVRARWPDGAVELERADEGWRMLAPLRGPADARSVDDLLSDLRFLRADGFDDAPPADAEAGLAPPDFEITLEIEPPAAAGDEAEAEPAGEAEGAPVATRELRVVIGSEREDGVRYVRAEEPSLYRIGSDRIARFPRDVVSYRFRQLAEFDTWDATRAELVFRPEGRDTSEEEQRLTARKEDGSWSSEPERIEPSKLSGLVRALSKLRARDILAESAGPDELLALGLDPPRVTLRVFGAAGADGDGGSEPDPEGEGDEALLAEVHLGVVREDGAVVARRPGYDTVFEAGPELGEEVPLSFEALGNRFLAAEDESSDEAAEPEFGAAPGQELGAQDGPDALPE